MKKYLNTVSAFQFYHLVRYSTLILIGIIFTKTTLTQKEIGEYETFLIIGSAVSFFWLNGLLKALLPLTSKNSNSNIFSAFIVIQFFSIIAAILLNFVQPLFSNYLLNGKNIPEAELLLLFLIFGVPASLVEYYYLIKKWNKSIVIYSIITHITQLLLVALPPVLGYDIAFAIIGLVIVSFLRYLWLWLIMILNSEIHFSISFAQEHLKLGTPLIVATLLSASAQFIDGFIVTSKFNEETFAMFRYGARELPLALLLTNALSNALLPEFAQRKNLEENLARLKASITKLSHFLFPITVILLLTSHYIFPIIFNSNFEKSATIFNIYLLLIISRLLMPQTILNGLRITTPILSASFLELIVNVTLSLILINHFGIAGIAYATVVAYVLEKIFLMIIVKTNLKIMISKYLPTKIYSIYSFVVVVIFIFAEYIFR